MKIAIIGSRSVDPSNELIAQHLPPFTDAIISGGAQGADRAAARYAKAHGIELVEFLPDYDKHGRRAPLVRNQLIVDAADHVIAFWDGHSRGTMHTVGLAKKAGKTVMIARCEAKPVQSPPQTEGI